MTKEAVIVVTVQRWEDATEDERSMTIREPPFHRCLACKVRVLITHSTLALAAARLHVEGPHNRVDMLCEDCARSAEPH